MTTKNKDSLKGILKDIEQERRVESVAASKLKVDNRKALKDLEDKGFNRVIITPNLEPDPEPEPEVVELPKKKIVKATVIPPKKDLKDKEIEELKKLVEELKVAKEEPVVVEEPELIEETE